MIIALSHRSEVAEGKGLLSTMHEGRAREVSVLSGDVLSGW